ncbi:MAG: TetR/AcrR family transcriptional regulator [Verrucomicrobiota bacterium]
MAEKVFSQKGFLSASISDVVNGLGISAGALYHHFPSKHALLAGVAKRIMKTMEEQMDAWLSDDTLRPSEKMDRFLDMVNDRRQLKKKFWRVELNMGEQDREIHEMLIQTMLEPASERLSRMIEQGNKTGDFHVTHPRSTAVLIILLVSEYMHRSRRLEELVPAKTLEQTFSQSIDQLLMRNKFTP